MDKTLGLARRHDHNLMIQFRNIEQCSETGAIFRSVRCCLYRLSVVPLLLLLIACDGQQRASGQGIVSLAPAITETLYELDLADQLIGRSDYATFPPRVVELPPMGTALAPSFEAIARARPAVIVTDASGHAHNEALSRIAPVIELPWLTLDDVTDSIRRLGESFGRGERATAMANRMQRVLGAPPPAEGPRVLLAMEGADASQVWYIRRNSLHGRALHAAGARNAVARDVQSAAVLAPEELTAANPDIIIVLATRGEADEIRAAARRRFAAFERLAAVRHERIGAVVGERFLLPGPSILDLVDALRAEIFLTMERPVPARPALPDDLGGRAERDNIYDQGY